MERVVALSRSYKCTHVRLVIPLEGGGVKRRRCDMTATAVVTASLAGGLSMSKRVCGHHAARYREALGHEVPVKSVSVSSV